MRRLSLWFYCNLTINLMLAEGGGVGDLGGCMLKLPDFLAIARARKVAMT